MQNSNICLSLPSPSCGSNGLANNRLGEMGEYILISPSEDSAPSGEQAHSVQGPRSSRRPRLTPRTLVRRGKQQGRKKANPRKRDFSTSTRERLVDATSLVLKFDRVQFLKHFWVKSTSLDIADALVKSQRASTIRQLESCWKKFQAFIKNEGISPISKKSVLQFLTHLFQMGYSPKTILVYRNAIRIPIKLAFNISTGIRNFLSYPEAISYRDHLRELFSLTGLSERC